MLTALHIENIAVVKRLDIELSKGMTVLTGETGAGKSIIIDSLNLLSGARADKELIRSGESKAEVSAVFSDICEETQTRISELGFECEDGAIFISRTLSASSSTARINGTPVTLAMLKKLSSLLFGIHGQNDNALLLEAKNHLTVLDTYADNESLLSEYSRRYAEVIALRRKLKELSRDVLEQNRMSDILKLQIEDINSARLKDGEEEELELLSLRLREAEKISKARNLVQRALEGGKGMGAIYLTDRAASAIESVSDAVPEAKALALRLNEVKYELEDIASSLDGLFELGEDNPEAALDKIEARLDVISRLKKKYGATVEEILAFRDEAASKLEFIENADDMKVDLENELNEAIASAKEIAKELTSSRSKAAHGLTKKVCETLAFLDMPSVSFLVSINPSADFSPTGCDEVEFLISANVGEPPAPMAKIASGGELARIMLSLKNEINQCDGIDTVIFDEIDTGISGKTSRKVGIKLKEIGKSSQVICVTHSAQIASLADSHLFVSKSESCGRTESYVRPLDSDERICEIARILGGIEITKTQLAAAEEMLRDGAEL